MKSKTSSFNWTVFKKDVTRFAPAWGIYLVGLLLVFHGIIQDSVAYLDSVNVGSWISSMAIVTCGYALLVALLLFGDLFNARICNALHALPLGRKGWYITHVLAGLCFGWVPQLLVAVSFLPRMMPYGIRCVAWFAGSSLEYFFFFAVAVFCVFCTGSRFATAVFYGLMNFMTILASWFVQVAYEPFLYGVVIKKEWAAMGCPAIWLVGHDDWLGSYDQITMYGEQLGKPWYYLFTLVAIAVVIYIVALQLYRKRQLECAGDFVAVKLLKPVFLVVHTLTVGALFQLFDSIFLYNDAGMLFLFVGTMVGFFTGLMLLHRSVKVLKWKNAACFAVFVAVLWGSFGITRLDPMGVVTWVPEEKNVAYAQIGNWRVEDGYMAKDSDQIQQVIDLHRETLENRRINEECEQGGFRTSHLNINYTMNDGRVVERAYSIASDGEMARKLRPYFSAPEVVMRYSRWEDFLSKLVAIQVDYRDDLQLVGEEAKDLAEAVKKDCEAGTMPQSWDYCDMKAVVAVNLTIISASGMTTDLVVYDNCVHTLQWLDAHGVEVHIPS